MQCRSDRFVSDCCSCLWRRNWTRGKMCEKRTGMEAEMIKAREAQTARRTTKGKYQMKRIVNKNRAKGVDTWSSRFITRSRDYFAPHTFKSFSKSSSRKEWDDLQERITYPSLFVIREGVRTSKCACYSPGCRYFTCAWTVMQIQGIKQIGFFGGFFYNKFNNNKYFTDPCYGMHGSYIGTPSPLVTGLLVISSVITILKQVQLKK